VLVKFGNISRGQRSRRKGGAQNVWKKRPEPQTANGVDSLYYQSPTTQHCPNPSIQFGYVDREPIMVLLGTWIEVIETATGACGGFRVQSWCGSAAVILVGVVVGVVIDVFALVVAVGGAVAIVCSSCCCSCCCCCRWCRCRCCCCFWRSMRYTWPFLLSLNWHKLVLFRT